MHTLTVENEFFETYTEDISVPARRINEIVHGKRAVTADTAIRLALALGTSEQFWMGLQADFDLEKAKKLVKKELDKIELVQA